MPTILSVSLRVEMLLKRQPAKTQYLAESGKLVERTLRLPPDETSSTVRAPTAVAVETWTSNLEIVARSSFEQVVIHSREELLLLSCRVWRVQEFEPLELICLTIASVIHSLFRVGPTSQRLQGPTCALDRPPWLPDFCYVTLERSVCGKAAERLRTC